MLLVGGQKGYMDVKRAIYPPPRFVGNQPNLELRCKKKVDETKLAALIKFRQ